MGKYKKLPVEIEAILWEGEKSFDKLYHFADADNNYGVVGMKDGRSDIAEIRILEGIMSAQVGDYIIKGIKGELYPCKPDIFESTYQKVECKTNLTFEEAEKLLEKGDCIALPEWEGFWFKRIDSDIVFVLTAEGQILKTPHEEFKERNDWKVVEPSKNQAQIIFEYFISNKELTFGQKLVGLTFNPSGDDRIGNVKQLFSDAIDAIGDPSVDTERRSYSYNIIRTVAINACWTAQISVVKFLTWKE